MHLTSTPSSRPGLTPGRTALAALLFLTLGPSSASAQIPDKAAASCINSTNKGAQLVAKAAALVAVGCAKDVGKGNAADYTACVAADAKGKVGGASAVLDKLDGKKCATTPAFGYAPPSTVTAAATFAVTNLFGDLLGETPTAALDSGDKEIATCQGIVLKQASGALRARLKAFAGCKKDALKIGAFQQASDLATTCYDALSADTGGKLAKTQGKLAGLVTKKCSAPDVAFPGTCAAAPDFAECVSERANCATCRLLNGADGLARDCDEFDDGVINESCSTCGNDKVEPGEICDDGGLSSCCSDQCNASNEGGSCDDGLFCTLTDQCNAGQCQGSGDPCSAGGECADTCDEGAASCNLPVETACSDDADPCTDDVCDGAGACTHPFNTAPCDDADACTTLDTCFEGVCVGMTVPPAETVMSDDFDNAELDPAWAIAFTGVATGWTFAEAGTDLTVDDIGTSTFDQWAYTELTRDVTPTQDFRFSFEMGWDSAGSLTPIQSIRVALYDSLGGLIADGAFNDAWVGDTGTLRWEIAGCPSGCVGNEARGTQPLAGQADFVIQRISNQVEIRKNGGVVYDGEGTTAEVESILIEFGHWKYSAAGGSPTFGSESMDFVTFEAVNAACPE